MPPPPPPAPVVCPVVYFSNVGCIAPTQAPSGPIFCWNNTDPAVVAALNGTSALSFSVDCVALGLGTISVWSGGSCNGTETPILIASSSWGCGQLVYEQLLGIFVTTEDLCQVTCALPPPAPLPLPAPIPQPVPIPAPVPLPLPRPAPVPIPAPVPVPVPVPAPILPPPAPTPTPTTTTSEEQKIIVGVTGGLAAGIGFILFVILMCCLFGGRRSDPLLTRTFGTGIGQPIPKSRVAPLNADGRFILAAAREQREQQRKHQ